MQPSTFEYSFLMRALCFVLGSAIGAQLLSSDDARATSCPAGSSQERTYELVEALRDDIPMDVNPTSFSDELTVVSLESGAIAVYGDRAEVKIFLGEGAE